MPMEYENLGNVQLQAPDDVALWFGQQSPDQGASPEGAGGPPRQRAPGPKLPFSVMPSWTDRSLYHYWLSTDFKAYLTGGTSPWQKLQAVALGVIALALVGTSIFTYLVTQQNTPPDVVGSATNGLGQYTPEQLQAIAEGASNAKK